MSKISFFQSIRIKTSLLFFVVFLIVIVPVNYIIYKKIKKVVAEADVKELQLEAEKLLNQVRLDPRQIPLPKKGYSEKIQLNSEVYFEDIFSSPDFPPLDPSLYFLDTYQQDTLVFVTLKRSLEYSSGTLLLTLCRSDRPLRSTLEELKNYLFFANAVSVLLAGILVFVVTGFSLNPIQKIATSAQRVNASNSIERVPVPIAQDEYRQLAEAINAMLARIEASIKTQTNFFASAAHELKTSLTVMKAELTLVLQQNQNSEVNKILVSNLHEVQRLDHIIHNFLLISQLKTENITLRRRLVELDEVCITALKSVKYLAQERGSSVSLTIEEHSFLIDIDFDMMETVVSNLLENALKYSPHGSVVKVEIVKDPLVKLKVINPLLKPIQSLNRLTEEFYKGEPQSSGLGLGLWICQRLITIVLIRIASLCSQ